MRLRKLREASRGRAPQCARARGLDHRAQRRFTSAHQKTPAMPAFFIEPLEARIAPAAIFTYIDVDGDLVTIKTSKGTDTQLADIVVPFLSSEGVPNGQELQQIDFSMNAAVFKGTDLSVTAVRTNGAGDGRVNVGYIDATSTTMARARSRECEDQR